MKRNFLLSVFLLGFFTVLASAQVDISSGVARISLIQGDVSTQRGDTGDWAAAALNQPLVGGDGSRQETVPRPSCNSTMRTSFVSVTTRKQRSQP